MSHIKRTDGDKFSVQSIFAGLSHLGGGGKKEAASGVSPAVTTRKEPEDHATIKIERSDGLNNDLIHLATRVMTEQKVATTVLAPTTCRIVHFSDTYNHLRRQNGTKMLPEGDIMIHSGGFTSNGTPDEYARFNRWLFAVKDLYRYRVVVPGQNDVKQCGDDLDFVRANLPNATHVLCDSEEKVLGLRIFGAAWHHHLQTVVQRPSGTNILVRSSASRGVDDRNRFDEIPAGIDVLVSHGAAYGKLDFADLRGCEHGHSHSHSHSHSHGYSESSLRPRSDADTPGLARKGSRELLHAIKRIRPGLHLHGLAAEARGVMYPQDKEGLYPLTVNSVMTDPHALVLYAVPHVIQCAYHPSPSSSSAPAQVVSSAGGGDGTGDVVVKAPPAADVGIGPGRDARDTSSKGRSDAWEFEIASPFF